MADRGPGVRAADRLGQSPKVICSRSAPISARNVLEREIRRATSKEPTTAHRSGHSTRDQRVADTASRQLITQRSLVQIQPPQRTTANAPRTTDRSATARAAFSLAIPSKLRSVPCGRRLTLRGSIGRARSPPSVERRPSCREISPVSERFAERRVISAVFVDVVGSTALTVALGPERLKRALDRAFRELSAIIAAEGGTVEKYVGDAVHALFGAPTAHPDDPQRALQAAHACLAWAEARTGVPVPFAVRVGVETGEAIVDLSAVATDREQMSIGTCVNVAARLQQLAEPGQGLVGPTCHGVTLETAEFLALGALELKGLGRMSVWRLVRPLPVVPATPLTFVGREAELDVPPLAYRPGASGRSVLALISGPPGQGKTRLVDEVVAGVRAEAQVLMARCRPP